MTDRTERSPRGRLAAWLVVAFVALLPACETGSTEVTRPTGTTETAPTGATATGPTATGPTGTTGAQLEGTWSGTWTTGGAVTGTFSLEITPTPGGFEGTIDIQGSPCVSGGTVEIGLEGDRITIGVIDAEAPITFDGTISGDQMSGTFDSDCPPPNTGSWEAALAT